MGSHFQRIELVRHKSLETRLGSKKMQWLIDIIKEWVLAQGYATQAWVQAQGYLTTSFVDRGDPAIEDFNSGDITDDDAWHDMDLSGIVPAGAKAVAISVSMLAVQTGLAFYLRRKGNANAFNVAVGYTQVAYLAKGLDLVVPLDGDRFIQYNAANGNWLVLDVTVKGWWL